jgi:oligoribonuclease
MATNWVWLDLEMTGLDVEKCAIIELGMVISGPDMAPVAEFERAIWQPEEVLTRMEPFVTQMHTDNGLLRRVRASTVTLRDAEKDALQLLHRHCGYKEAILLGNSIHTDRSFLKRHMPHLEDFLHYRQVDVTAFKVLSRAWFPNDPEFQKPGADHTALADVKQSMAELAHYRQRFFKA